MSLQCLQIAQLITFQVMDIRDFWNNLKVWTRRVFGKHLSVSPANPLARNNISLSTNKKSKSILKTRNKYADSLSLSQSSKGDCYETLNAKGRRGRLVSYKKFLQELSSVSQSFSQNSHLSQKKDPRKRTKKIEKVKQPIKKPQSILKELKEEKSLFFTNDFGDELSSISVQNQWEENESDVQFFNHALTEISDGENEPNLNGSQNFLPQLSEEKKVMTKKTVTVEPHTQELEIRKPLQSLRLKTKKVVKRSSNDS